jgi:hypothetical protein
MYLIIIFILGTLCVIFNEKIGEFFSPKKKKNQTATAGVLERFA